MKDVLTTLEHEEELGKNVSIAGEKLAHLSLSKDDLLSSSKEVTECFQQVKQ